MKSKAAFMGHPIHPMLVTLPIGLWVAALVCDIVFATTHTVFWYDMAYWSMAFGLVGGAIAAIPGLIDFATALQNSERARATARNHLILNAVVMAAYAVNVYLRGDYAAVGGGLFAGVVALSVVSLAVLSLSGFLGGRLVYEYGVGLDRDDMRVSMLEAEREEAAKH